MTQIPVYIQNKFKNKQKNFKQKYFLKKCLWPPFYSTERRFCRPKSHFCVAIVFQTWLKCLILTGAGGFMSLCITQRQIKSKRDVITVCVCVWQLSWPYNPVYTRSNNRSLTSHGAARCPRANMEVLGILAFVQILWWDLCGHVAFLLRGNQVCQWQKSKYWQ